MPFILETIIGEIHDFYAALPGGRERPEVLLGNSEKARNAEPPRIVWVLQGGQFGDSTLSGGPDGAMAQAIARFQVWIWQADLQACWDVMADLMAAVRKSVYGPNAAFQSFTAPTETQGRDTHLGEVFVLELSISVPIKTEGTVALEEVEIESHEATVTADDGDEVAFETVIVDGPPA